MVTETKVMRIATAFIRSRYRFTTVDDIFEIYKSSLNNRKQKIAELVRERIQRGLNSELVEKIKVAKGFYTLEMAPPKLNELQKLKEDLALAKQFMQSGCFKHLTVRQAWLLIMVSLEIGLWFYLGETIGKMHVVGYKV